jgi:hypothetical protein
MTNPHAWGYFPLVTKLPKKSMRQNALRYVIIWRIQASKLAKVVLGTNQAKSIPDFGLFA